ncbi:caspase family protein [Bradyrhizobium sp. JYMT SZCCT0180]|uniref:caspase family protein n=1 Tax=Bradyrhizobium sp. JYMT SZCCT0180 TaxID=2807666 RepID=UPI002012F792|nr:caspase family protein [Bradyrhizobium sp. JYMT SZCCT0180]
MAAGFSGTAHAQKRIALVVGNSAYKNVSHLDNPKNDARLIADTLRALGFTLTGGAAQVDLDKASLDRAVQSFGNQLMGAEVALFYFAGHGVQLRNSNYLIPVDANLIKESDVDFQMVDVGLVLRQMEGSGTKLNLVILDACRNNPFGGRGLRAASRGLGRIDAPEGTMISFATQPGNVALDGNDGNSPFTKALATTMRKPGLDIFQTFNEVGISVKRATAGAQLPWVSSSPIDGSFYFTSPKTGAPSAAAPAQVDKANEAARAWSLTRDTTSQAVLSDFIRQFGGTVYGSMARARLEELKKDQIAAITPPPASGKPSQAQEAALPAIAADAKLLGRFDHWSAYTATARGSRICFALTASPKARSGGKAYAMVTTRPNDKVVNEVSILTDYKVMGGSDPSTLEVGSESYAMYGQGNSYWIKNLSDESRLVGAMRVGTEIALKGRTAEGSAKNDSYSLKGFAQALDRANRECR